MIWGLYDIYNSYLLLLWDFFLIRMDTTISNFTFTKLRIEWQISRHLLNYIFDKFNQTVKDNNDILLVIFNCKTTSRRYERISSYFFEYTFSHIYNFPPYLSLDHVSCCNFPHFNHPGYHCKQFSYLPINTSYGIQYSSHICWGCNKYHLDLTYKG